MSALDVAIVAAFGVAEQQAGLLLLPLVLASTVGSVRFGRLLNALGSRLVLLLGFGLLTGGSALLGLFPASMPNFFVATVVLGLGVGSVVGGALRFIVLNEVGPEARAAAQGLVNIGISIGNLLVVASLGAIADSRGGGTPGYAAAYLVAAVIAGGMLTLTLGLKGRAAELRALGEQAQETSPAPAPGL
jgi:MFS family permease